MLAQFPMYDHPGVRAETDAFWAEIRDRLRETGIDAPETLTRSDDLHAEWHSPDLLFGQACGLPFRVELHQKVALIGTLDYGLPDIPPGHYNSVFVARRDDPRSRLEEFDGAVLAFNDRHSQSGWGTACEAPLCFRVGPETGSHRDAAIAIAEGRADIAALDAISWRLIQAHTDLAEPLKTLGMSGHSPGQALITAFPQHLPSLRSAIREGIAALPAASREALGIRAFLQTSPSDYLAVPNPPSPEAYAVVAA
ncbi:PhnD/SsuA/transferrin family substrate-binding protein [Tropicimonas sp. TH_r6]|uniref:phosphate/phosphite/phosphonate ABC transporter substrate-binding protein n=1 Tax=Tropicimonas sp. TH_r6 TaxID=3082085 RepID=UPI0029554B0C|nr:PhnD/SsuA/transferrin family substrate-binding protein [Tropicimonas sp. TH_r6]MDV7144483.1 PhnD/SsuA/transferrin family substrate-binding protein [Tropicimonas sp. TH_r6]